MKADSYIKKIIEATGLSKREIQNKVKEKKDELKGLISEEGALFIIAKEYGVDVKEENRDLLKDIDINTEDIKPGMKNITLVGRIKTIFKVYSFDKKQGGKGFVGSFLIQDKTGDMRIVLWDDHTKIFKNNDFDIGTLVKIVNGYAKKGKNESRVEVHVGKLGKVIMSPEDVDYKKYPKIENSYIPINEIELSYNSVSIEGKIIQKFPIKKFTRKDGEDGKVGSIRVMDSTDTIRVTFWDENVDKLNQLELGNFVGITNLSPRKNKYKDSIDLNASNYSKITKKNKDINLESTIIENIGKLQDKKGIISVKGVVTSIDNLKNITLKSGEEISLLGFVISDQTDAIRVTIWRELAEKYAKKLKKGMGVLLKNVMVKYSSYSKRNEINFLTTSGLEKIELEFEELKEIKQENGSSGGYFSGEIRAIEEIDSAGTFEIQGFLAKIFKNITVYDACKECYKKKENCTCEGETETEKRMIVNAIIDDETDTIRATFIGDKAEKLIGEPTDIISKIKETPDFDNFINQKTKELLGKELVLRGKAKFSDFSNNYELIIYDFKKLEIEKRLEKIMQEL
ncbi:MAG: DUF2240 family protein [Promethearchaeia archaeon]